MWKIKRLHELSTIELLNIMIERVSIFVVEQNCPYQEIDLDDKNCIHVFKEEDNKIIAYFRLIETDKYIKLGRVIVNKNHRGKGLGNELLNKVKEICDEIYPNYDIYAQAQAHLEKYYNQIGLKKESDIYLEDNIPHIDMYCRR